MNSIYIPSFNRWESVKTFEYLESGTIVVPESQFLNYKKRYGKNVVSIPNKKDGSVAKKRNAILELIKEREPDGWAWICDDDLICIKEKKHQKKLTGDEALEAMERVQIMAEDMQAWLGGFDYSPDNLKLKDFQPFSFTKPVFGNALINVLDGIKYDENFRITEDVEFWASKMNKNRFMIRENRFVCVFNGEDGGKESVIKYSIEDKKKFAKQINNKWGRQIMVWNKTRFEFRIPIKGA